jgi:hypothetical protein
LPEAGFYPVQLPNEVIVIVAQLHRGNHCCQMLAQFRVSKVFREPPMEMLFVTAV